VSFSRACFASLARAISLLLHHSGVASRWCCILLVLSHLVPFSHVASLSRAIFLVLHHSGIASHFGYYSRMLHCITLGTLLAPPNISRVATPLPPLFPVSLALSLRSSLPPSLPPSRPPSILPKSFPLRLLPPSLANWLLVRKCAKVCRSSHHDMQKITQRHTQDDTRSHKDTHKMTQSLCTSSRTSKTYTRSHHDFAQADARHDMAW